VRHRHAVSGSAGSFRTLTAGSEWIALPRFVRQDLKSDLWCCIQSRTKTTNDFQPLFSGLSTSFLGAGKRAFLDKYYVSVRNFWNYCI
jgi:hypothetical protein